MKNILVVEGTSGGRNFPNEIIRQGGTPYHLLATDNTIDINTLPEKLKIYFATKILKIDKNIYKKCFKISNYKNYNELIDELKKYNFHGVIPGSEGGVETAEKIATSLKIPTNDPLLADTRQNKYEMQKKLKENSLDYIPYVFTANINDIFSFMKKNNYKKIVLKEILGDSTDNVFICKNKNDISNAYKKILSTLDTHGNKNSKVLVEKFIDGEEIVINITVKKGQKNIISMYRYGKMIIKGVPTYDFMELINNLDGKYNDAINYTYDVLNAFGMKNTVAHSELKFDSDTGKYVLIETAARTPGYLITGNSFKKELGYTEHEKIVDVYMNNDNYTYQEYKPHKDAHIMYKMLIFYSNSGIKVDQKKIINYLKSIKGISNVEWKEHFTHVKKTIDFLTSPGIVAIHTRNIDVYNNAYKKTKELELNDYQI